MSFSKLLSTPLTGTPVEGFSLIDELVESTNCFFDRNLRVRAMSKYNINIV
jgi:hypothetical protein